MSGSPRRVLCSLPPCGPPTVCRGDGVRGGIARRPADRGAIRLPRNRRRAMLDCRAGGSELVGCGTPRACEVRIVDPETLRELPAGEVGEIGCTAIRSQPLLARNPELTAPYVRRSVVAPTEGTPKGPWLKTGDLGVIFDGELFIIGRIKDLADRRRRNHYPEDIEMTIGEITAGRVAAARFRTAPPRSSWRPRNQTSRRLARRGGCEASRPEAAGPRDRQECSRRCGSATRADRPGIAADHHQRQRSGGRQCVEQYRLDQFSRMDAT